MDVQGESNFMRSSGTLTFVDFEDRVESRTSIRAIIGEAEPGEPEILPCATVCIEDTKTLFDETHYVIKIEDIRTGEEKRIMRCYDDFAQLNEALRKEDTLALPDLPEQINDRLMMRQRAPVHVDQLGGRRRNAAAGDELKEDLQRYLNEVFVQVPSLEGVPMLHEFVTLAVTAKTRKQWSDRQHAAHMSAESCEPGQDGEAQPAVVETTTSDRLEVAAQPASPPAVIKRTAADRLEVTEGDLDSQMVHLSSGSKATVDTKRAEEEVQESLGMAAQPASPPAVAVTTAADGPEAPQRDFHSQSTMAQLSSGSKATADTERADEEVQESLGTLHSQCIMVQLSSGGKAMADTERAEEKAQESREAAAQRLFRLPPNTPARSGVHPAFQEPVVGDALKILDSDRIGTIVEDDGSALPYRVTFNNDTFYPREVWFKKDQVAKHIQELEVGDAVRVLRSKRIGTLKEDDGSGLPYKVAFDDPPRELWFKRYDLKKYDQASMLASMPMLFRNVSTATASAIALHRAVSTSTLPQMPFEEVFAPGTKVLIDGLANKPRHNRTEGIVFEHLADEQYQVYIKGKRKRVGKKHVFRATTMPNGLVVTRQEAIDRLVEKLGPRVRLCILGGTNFYGKDSEALITGLSAALARDIPATDIAYITGGLPGIQEAFAKSCGAGENVYNLVQVGEASNYGVGEDMQAGADMSERRAVFGFLGDIYLTVEGGPGVAEEAGFGFCRGAMVVPLIRTGAASAGNFGFPQEALKPPDFAMRDDWELLGNTEAPVEDTVQAAAKLIKDFVARVRAGD